MTTQDTLGTLAGLDREASERLRGHRPAVTEAAEASLHALFDVPEDDEAPGLDRRLRLVAAARAAHVDGSDAVAAFYAEQLLEEADDVDAPGLAELVTGGADGEAGRAAGRAERALLRHVDLLVQRPAAATSDDLDALAAAGWGVVEIVVLSQIVSFVTYQTRVVAGLAVLQEASA
ncbi:hypothetical protein MUN78_13340 [Leucobacter allii]|uniref:CMD domain protein n=1 Tax=Leucobacter allii TaxID=2932247 RepID=A0ABY4FIY6_9MICO|nr:hypothetical protein [Leucobacter allii]UOQ56649.1 hypothetical protein MUN78_13340 [Leucobacter allii]UOR01083.1 hypothetical protein MUN77_13175 [Leucobacter allii]